MRRFAQNLRFYILIAFLLVMSSCVKEMDFGGVKEIKLEPSMEIKLLEARITQDTLVAIASTVSGSSIGYIPGSIPIDPDPIRESINLNSKERILKYLVDGKDTLNGNSVATPVLNFVFINTIDRPIDIKISLRDEQNNELKEIEKYPELHIKNSTTGIPEEYNFTYTADQIRSATAIVIDIKMNTGANLFPGTDRKLTIEATGLFNFSYDPSEGLP